MNLPAPEDYRFRFKELPYSPKGPACQRVEVRVNGQFVRTVSFAQFGTGIKSTCPKKLSLRDGTLFNFSTMMPSRLVPRLGSTNAG